jgi:NAD(P)-dependent dehydrogenase (short-subunit alcohol dehydrogenase family)
VVNAASMVFGHFEDVSAEDFDRTIAITFTGAVDTVRCALPHLIAARGTLVVVGSLMTKVPLPTFGSYAAAKHGLRGFVNSLRIELAQRDTGVQVAMVHPGPVDTPLWHNVSSALPNQVRTPPDSYAPEVLARAIVSCARRPRRELTVGGETRAMELGYQYLPAVADRVLRLVDRWYSSGKEPAPVPGGLWEAQGAGRCNGGARGRPSLLEAVRQRVRP